MKKPPYHPIIRHLMKRNTWADKCKLEYWFGIDADNDPRNGADSGEPPEGEDFITNN